MNYFMHSQLISEGFKPEQVNNMEKQMINEGEKLDKFKKAAKKTALGMAAGAVLGAVPGVKGGIENYKQKTQDRNEQKIADIKNAEASKQARLAMAKKIHDLGVDTKEDLDALYKAGKIKLAEYKAALADFPNEEEAKVKGKKFSYFPY